MNNINIFLMSYLPEEMLDVSYVEKVVCNVKVCPMKFL